MSGITLYHAIAGLEANRYTPEQIGAGFLLCVADIARTTRDALLSELYSGSMISGKDTERRVKRNFVRILRGGLARKKAPVSPERLGRQLADLDLANDNNPSIEARAINGFRRAADQMDYLCRLGIALKEGARLYDDGLERTGDMPWAEYDMILSHLPER